MESFTLLFLLLIIFQLKHFVADYLLQGPIPYILHGKGKLKGWFGPLFVHACIHAGLTFSIAYFSTLSITFAAFVFSIDLVAHFIIDRVKASPNMLGRFKPENMFFWFSLGFDQMLHHLTHYTIIYLILNEGIKL